MAHPGFAVRQALDGLLNGRKARHSLQISKNSFPLVERERGGGGESFEGEFLERDTCVETHAQRTPGIIAKY